VGNKFYIGAVHKTHPIIFCGRCFYQASTIFHDGTEMPVSSKVSLIAAFSGVSNGSSFPPTEYNYLYWVLSVVLIAEFLPVFQHT
jgi:hypothetical protein